MGSFADLVVTFLIGAFAMFTLLLVGSYMLDTITCAIVLCLMFCWKVTFSAALDFARTNYVTFTPHMYLLVLVDFVDKVVFDTFKIFM